MSVTSRCIRKPTFSATDQIFANLFICCCLYIT